MSLAWVIGSGGMLGKALSTELAKSEDSLFDSTVQFNWREIDVAREQLQQATQRFSLQAGKGPWVIYWTAGIGSMHSSEEELQAETNLLESLIASLFQDPNLNLKAGSFVFASSAGAIYAGAPEGVITESTDPSPINAYGRTKLAQESLINKLNKSGQGASVIFCRISTLYGFKAKDGKQQGLIAEMVRKSLSNEVVHIYVPLETMRDYISVGNAAKQMIEAKELFEKTPGIHLKIIASGVSSSVAQILAIVKGICKRNLRVVTQADVKSVQYQRMVQFKSGTNTSNNRNNLIEGISDLSNTIQKDIAKNGIRS